MRRVSPGEERIHKPFQPAEAQHDVGDDAEDREHKPFQPEPETEAHEAGHVEQQSPMEDMAAGVGNEAFTKMVKGG